MAHTELQPEETLDALSDLIWVHGFGNLVSAVATDIDETQLRVRVGGDFDAAYRLEVRSGAATIARDLSPETPAEAEIDWTLSVGDVSDALAGVDVLARALEAGTLRFEVSESGQRKLQALLRAIRQLDWQSYFDASQHDGLRGLAEDAIARQERASMGLGSGSPSSLVSVRIPKKGTHS